MQTSYHEGFRDFIENFGLLGSFMLLGDGTVPLICGRDWFFKFSSKCIQVTQQAWTTKVSDGIKITEDVLNWCRRQEETRFTRYRFQSRECQGAIRVLEAVPFVDH